MLEFLNGHPWLYLLRREWESVQFSLCHSGLASWWPLVVDSSLLLPIFFPFLYLHSERMVESQSSGCSKIRTAPTSGGFLINSKISSFSRFMSLWILGSLDACGTENLSLSGIDLVISSCSDSGCSSPQIWRMVSIFPLICVVGSV